ncbi:unnamed protein product [Parascedosporium putredinis]|uniref:Uncharacterized protein n=1 Tax=Parascedosporium putredinis TaxID=1442378 RepID=A0A9P1MG57_9PEZI|nr:unnamed protein product [Parascedosporium putredinis]CAI8003823.1 unnamed protein product [Parascedosporium putredinis]
MIFSPLLKSSANSTPSLDGQMVATLLSSKIIIRSSELSGPVSTFIWSPSSSKVLLATASHIHVLDTANSGFRAACGLRMGDGSSPGSRHLRAINYCSTRRTVIFSDRYTPDMARTAQSSGFVNTYFSYLSEGQSAHIPASSSGYRELGFR